MEKRLYRSKDERMIWGICNGITKHYDMDPTIVRVIAVLTAFLWGIGPVALSNPQVRYPAGTIESCCYR